MINPLKVKTVLVAIAAIPSLTFAQNYDVKKGKVSIDKNVIATYDGKGGLLRSFDLTVSSPAQKPLFTIKEQYCDFKNPLRRDAVRWAEVTFLDNPEKKMSFHFPNDERPLERGLVAYFFKDSTPSLVQAEALNVQAVDEFIKKNSYDFIADSLAVRKFEKENKDRIMEPLERDKKQAVSLKLGTGDKIVKSDAMENITFFDIFQDGVLLGQVEKHITTSVNFGTKAYYVIWKRVLAPYTYEGKQMRFGILAYIKTDSPTFDQELVLMTDKSTLKYKTKDHTSSQYQIVDLLISAGLL
jgi:hypothetical protein